MEAFLEIELIQDDPSFIRVSAANGLFSGFAEAYINSGWLFAFARALSDFPSAKEAEVKFDSMPREDERSSVRFRVYCRDALGHCSMEINLSNDLRDDGGDAVRMNLDIELSSLDQFSQSVLQLESRGDGIVRLSGIKKNA